MSVLRFVGHGLAIGFGLLLSTPGCSDPTSPIPQGAFSVTFGNPLATGVTATCPATQPSPQVQVGSVGPDKRTAVVDGENGASVSCRVSKSGSGFVVSGAILKGTAQLYMSAQVGEGKTNEGSVSVAGANTAGKSYGPETGTTCTFHLIKGEESQIWLGFECPHVVTGSADSEQCSLQNGYVVLENCES